jgi:membrane-bound lytic murein transglycosylase MltF
MINADFIPLLFEMDTELPSIKPLIQKVLEDIDW